MPTGHRQARPHPAAVTLFSPILRRRSSKSRCFSSDDIKKLKTLNEERDKCLVPAQIRIKPSDLDLKIFKKDLPMLQSAPCDPSESVSDD